LHREFEAWDVLVLKYQRLIYSVPLKIGLNPHDCADVFQTVCLALYRNLARLRDLPRLSSWLLTTAHREAIHVMQTERAQQRRARATAASELTPATANDFTESTLIALEQQILIRQAVASLPKRCAELLTILYYDQPTSSYQEIEARLKMPHGSIAPTRSRCLQHLRQKLARLGLP
jgi:RNA polymerase sigma factor (sigma-70 family)